MIRQYLNKDAFKVCKDLDDGTVDLLFTSVPDMSNMQGEYKKEDEESYNTFLDTFLTEATRLVHKKGFIILCQTDRKVKGRILSKHVKFINELTSRGFLLKDYKIMIKDKLNKVNLYRLNYSHVLIFTKNGTIPSNKRRGNYLNDVWVYPYPKGMFFDIEFARLIVDTFTRNDTDFVFDPFAGRGTVCKACLDLNRPFLGTELDSKTYNYDFVYGGGEEENKKEKNSKKLSKFVKK